MTYTDELVERLANAINSTAFAVSPLGAKIYARACLAEITAAGYAVVPVVPTEEMLNAAHAFDWGPGGGSKDEADANKVWTAMLNANMKDDK